MFQLCVWRNRQARLVALLVVASVIGSENFASAQATSKADRILDQDGFQIVGNADPGGNFDLSSFLAANYTTVSWQGIRFGSPASLPWSRWVNDPTQDPPQVGDASLSNLVGLQLADEPLQNGQGYPRDYNDMVTWTNAVQANPLFANTLVYTDLNGVDDTTLVNYIQNGHPDMIVFDTYPWQSTYVPNPQGGSGSAGAPIGGPPTGWYTDMRRYRADSLSNGIEFGIYRQTFHSIEDYDTRVYRDPSASEFALQTFAAQAFGAKMLIDFEVDDGATSLYNNNGNPAYPSALYPTVQKVNKTAGYFGKTLVYLQPIYANNEQYPTTDIVFMRGKQVVKNTDNTYSSNFNAVPDGFSTATQTSANTLFTTNTNDPWLTGFGQANFDSIQYNPTANNYAPGDAILSWFKPIGESLAQAKANDDIYFMIVNGLTTTSGSADDSLQNIHLDFTTFPSDSIQYIDPTTGQLITLNETGGTVTNATTDPAGTYLLTNTNGDLTNKTGKLRLNVFLDGGDGFLFKFNAGDAFIVPEPSCGALLVIGALLGVRRKRNHG